MSMLRATALLVLTSILVLTAGGRAAAGLYSLSVVAGGGEIAVFDQFVSGPTLPPDGASLADQGTVNLPLEFASNVGALATVYIGHQVVGLSVWPTIHLGLDAGASYTDLGSGPVDNMGASASLSYSDQLKVTILPFDLVGLTSLQLLGQIHVSGQIEGNAEMNAAMGTSTLIDLGDGSYSIDSFVPLGPIDLPLGEGVLTLPFTLSATAKAIADIDYPHSDADFSGSITLLGLELVDQNGNVIPATFTSDQGFNYLDVGTLSVPEPPSLVAWGMAALGLLAWRLASPGGANGDGGAGRGRG